MNAIPDRGKNIIFDRYHNLRVAKGSSISVIHLPKTKKEVSNAINLKYALAHRDEQIAAQLRLLNVNYITDIGSDFGHLISICRQYGIDGHGIEPNLEAISLAKDSGLDVRKGDYFSIIADPKNAFNSTEQDVAKNNDKISAISLLNVFSAYWPDPVVKTELVKTCIANCEYFVVTCYKRDLKYLLKNYNLEIETFIGARHKSVSRSKATLLQYGHPIFLRNSRLELVFWQKITKNRYVHEERIITYARHTVILKVLKPS